MTSLFRSASVNANPVDLSQPLPEKVNNENETVRKIIQNFVQFREQFEFKFSTFLNYVTPQEKNILENSNSDDAKELCQNIMKALTDGKLYPIELKRNPVIYKLHPSTVCKNIGAACKERFGDTNSPRNWLSAVNTVLEIRQFVPYAQYNALRYEVQTQLKVVKPQLWAAAIIHTLNYRDGCYVSRFHRSAFTQTGSDWNPYDVANKYMIFTRHPWTRHLEDNQYSTLVLGPIIRDYKYKEYNVGATSKILNESFILDQRQFEHAPKQTNPPQKKPTPQTPKKDAKSGQSQPKKQKGAKPATPGKPGNPNSKKGKKGKK